MGLTVQLRHDGWGKKLGKIHKVNGLCTWREPKMMNKLKTWARQLNVKR